MLPRWLNLHIHSGIQLVCPSVIPSVLSTLTPREWPFLNPSSIPRRALSCVPTSTPSTPSYLTTSSYPSIVLSSESSLEPSGHPSELPTLIPRHLQIHWPTKFSAIWNAVLFLSSILFYHSYFLLFLAMISQECQLQYQVDAYLSLTPLQCASGGSCLSSGSLPSGGSPVNPIYPLQKSRNVTIIADRMSKSVVLRSHLHLSPHLFHSRSPLPVLLLHSILFHHSSFFHLLPTLDCVIHTYIYTFNFYILQFTNIFAYP